MLQSLAMAAKTDPLLWIGQREIYGDTGQDPRFAAAFAVALKSLWADGTAHTLSRYLAA